MPLRSKLFLVALCQATGIVGLVWYGCYRFDVSSFVVFSTNVAVGQFDRLAIGSSVFCECFRGPAFSWFRVASLCRVVGRAENTLMVSFVFLKGAFLMPRLEDGEGDATYDAMLAAMSGLAPWCRTLVWLAPSCFQDFFAPRLAGNAGFLVGKKYYQVGFYEGQRKGCGSYNVTGSSKALLLLSLPQVILAVWCVAAAISGIFVASSAQAAASGAYVGILFSKFLCCAAAALSMSIALVVLYCDCFCGYGIRVAAASVFILVCAAAAFLAAAAWPFVGSLHGHVLGLRSLVLRLLTLVYMQIVIVDDFLYVVLAFWFASLSLMPVALTTQRVPL